MTPGDGQLETRLERLRAAAAACPPAPASAACPAAAWDEVVAGVPPPEEARERIRHAIACPHCGPLLRRAAEAVGAGATPELEAELEAVAAALPSSRPSGRRRLVQRLRQSELRFAHHAAPLRRAWIATTALAAAAVVLLAIWVPGRGRAWLAGSLVDRAYAQQRLLPLRFAGADYGPLVSARRGLPPSASGDLLEAEGLLADGLAKHPDDVGLLQAQARADLVAGNAAAALADLQRALVLRPADPGLETDLASAYYESAEGGRDADYGSALEYAGRALAARPRDPIALFNRARIEEAIEDWTGAIADWSAYLKVDAHGAWAEEARQHLTADQKLVTQHDAAVAAPLLSPAAFARLATVDAATDARIEAYLDAATTQWLPAAFPVSGPADAGARAGLRRLAAWLEQAHHDRWLAEVLQEASDRREFAQGVANLAAAIAANAAGHPDDALRAVRVAEAELTRASSPAAGARAAYEETYALYRAEQGTRCEAVLDRALPAAAIAPFAWLAGETDLERLNCEVMVGRSGQAALAQALDIAHNHGYASLLMRATSFTGDQAQNAASEPAWQLNRGQLALYWRARVGPYRAYQLYMMLAVYSSQQRNWFAAERLARAGVERVALSSDRSYQAMARQVLAGYADQCGFATEAHAEAVHAEALFAALPPTPTTANLRAYNQLDLAMMAMEAGQPQRARAALAVYRREQPPVVSPEARALPYFSILGQLELAQGRLDQSELDERAAIAIQESQLHRLGGGDDEDRLGWQQRNRDAYRAWVRIQWQLHRNPVVALEFWEWAKGGPVRPGHPLPASFLSAAQRFNSAGAPPLPEPDLVRSSLPGITAAQVVSYALYPRELDAWIYDDRGIHGVREPINGPRLESAAHAFAAACADPDTSSALLASQGRQLYQWLLAPLHSWLDPNRTLIVEPDGALAEIPFAALRLPGGDFLSELVMQSPGLAYARLAHPSRDLNEARLLAVGDPAGASGAGGGVLPPLPEAAAEAQDAAAAFGAGSRTLCGDAANRAAVLAALPRAGIFHFAGHAGSDRLLLADGEALTASDFAPALLPHCQLAVLDACSTGAGGTLLDSDGLVRALLRAGVPWVVATRWPVDSAATRQFSRLFYAALRAGQTVPRALQSAQQQLRRQPATAAPFYWAAFVPFGARM